MHGLPQKDAVMPPSMFVKGFLVNLGASLLTVLMTDIMLLNWMPLPVGYQLINAADTVIAFIVGSIPIALILKRDKPCKTDAAT